MLLLLMMITAALCVYEGGKENTKKASVTFTQTTRRNCKIPALKRQCEWGFGQQKAICILSLNSLNKYASA